MSKAGKKRSGGSANPEKRKGRASPARAATIKFAEIPRARKWLFGLVTFVMGPLLLLGILEVGLRLAGYGHSCEFFKSRRIGGQDLLVENDEFSLRFFAPELARMPGPIRMAARKAPETYRIFIFGESAAMGDPEPAFGASRYLEMLLRERFPQQRFEVINVAFTAINSHVILPIARECARHQGDLWIIYLGNNEMVGPYGAATVFGAQASPWQLVRVSLALRKTRLGQLVLTLSRKFGGHRPASWGGMQMFTANRVPPTDRRRETIYGNFRQNLKDILQAGGDAHAKILLNSVAVNLKDCPPFASFATSNLPVADRERLARLSDESSALAAKGSFAEAAQRCQGASRLDPASADLEFRWAESLLQLGNRDEAHQHFQKACDLDALPFRADSRINGTIRKLGQEMSQQGVVLCDTAARLEQDGAPTPSSASSLGQDEKPSKNARTRASALLLESALAEENEANSTTPRAVLPLGDETFYEHVHFNFDGNYRLARIWAEEVERMMSALVGQASRLPTGASRPRSNWLSQAACERWLGLTDWNRANVIEAVLRRMQQPPLSAQSNNGQRLAALQAWKNRLPLNATNAASAREIYQAAIERAPEDYCLHENFADFLAATRDLQHATVEWRRVAELLPDDYLANYRLAGVLAQQNQLPEAEAALDHAIKRRPFLDDAWFELGEVRAAQNKLEDSLKAYERARQLRPQAPECHLGRGKVLARLNRRAEALEDFRQAIRLNPAFWEAHDALGGQLGLAGDIGGAKSEFEQVIRLRPNYARGHLNLGVALLKENQAQNAALEFEQALRLDPTNTLARDYLRQAQNAAGAKH